MGEFLDQIPEKIQDHIRSITKTSGLPDTEESVEKIAEGWLQKEEKFGEEIEKMNMEEVDTLEKDDDRGAIAMTYSGSLISIGPLEDDFRKVSYTSIGIRQDVPSVVSKDDSVLKSNVEVDEAVEFEVGPIKKSSQLYKIAICKDDLSVEEEEEKIEQATMILTDEFVEVNKTIISE